MRPSLPLRPIRTLTLLTVLGVAATGCGVTADTTAATVGDRTISIDDVDAAIADPAVVGPDVEGIDESRQPGDVARAALMYEIQRVVWIEEAERWGVEPTDDDRALAEEQLDQQLAGSQVELSEATRDGAIESTAAQNALLARFAEIDPTDEGDLRLVYEGAPSRWREWCITVVAVATEEGDTVEDLLDEGVELEAVADQVDGAQLLATPEQCFVGSELPPELEQAARESAGGGRPDPVTTDLGTGEGLLFFDVESATTSTFEEAREEVAFVAQNLAGAVEQLSALSGLGADASEEEIQQAQQTREQGVTVVLEWIGERMRSAEVNPRYGSGVVARSEQLGGGYEVAAPPGPLQPVAAPTSLPGEIELDPAAAGG